MAPRGGCGGRSEETRVGDKKEVVMLGRIRAGRGVSKGRGRGASLLRIRGTVRGSGPAGSQCDAGRTAGQTGVGSGGHPRRRSRCGAQRRRPAGRSQRVHKLIPGAAGRSPQRAVRPSQRSKRSRPLLRWYSARSLVASISLGWKVGMSADPLHHEGGAVDHRSASTLLLIWRFQCGSIGPRAGSERTSRVG